MGPRSRITVQCIFVVGSLIFFRSGEAAGFGFNFGGGHETSHGSSGDGEYKASGQVGANHNGKHSYPIFDGKRRSSNSDGSEATEHKENPLGVTNEGASDYSSQYRHNGEHQYGSGRNPPGILKGLIQGMKEKVGDIAEKITNPFRDDHSVETQHHETHHGWGGSSGSEYGDKIKPTGPEEDYDKLSSRHESVSHFKPNHDTEQDHTTRTDYSYRHKTSANGQGGHGGYHGPDLKWSGTSGSEYGDKIEPTGPEEDYDKLSSRHDYDSHFKPSHDTEQDHTTRRGYNYQHEKSVNGQGEQDGYHGHDLKWSGTSGSEYGDKIKPTGPEEDYHKFPYSHDSDSNFKPSHDTEQDHTTRTDYNYRHKTSANGQGGHDGYHGHDLKWSGTSGSEYGDKIKPTGPEEDYHKFPYSHDYDSHFKPSHDTEQDHTTRRGYNFRHEKSVNGQSGHDGYHGHDLKWSGTSGSEYGDKIKSTGPEEDYDKFPYSHESYSHFKPSHDTEQDHTAGTDFNYHHVSESDFPEKSVNRHGHGHFGGMEDRNADPAKFLSNIFSKWQEELRSHLGSAQNQWKTFTKQLEPLFYGLNPSEALKKFNLEDMGGLKLELPGVGDGGLESIVHKFEMPSLDFHPSGQGYEHKELRPPFNIFPHFLSETTDHLNKMNRRVSEQSRDFFIRIQDFVDKLKGSGFGKGLSFEDLQRKMVPSNAPGLSYRGGYESGGDKPDYGQVLGRPRVGFPSGQSQRDQQFYGGGRHTIESASSNWDGGSRSGGGGGSSSFGFGSQGGGGGRKEGGFGWGSGGHSGLESAGGHSTREGSSGGGGSLSGGGGITPGNGFRLGGGGSSGGASFSRGGRGIGMELSGGGGRN